MHEGTIAPDDVFAPLTRECFLADTWTKSFLHLTGPKGRFTPLLPWEELNQILEWHAPSAATLKLFRGGQHLDPQLYIDGQGGGVRLNTGRLLAALSQGASLVMDEVQEIAPRVRALAESLTCTFRAPVIVNLYAGWGRDNAFPLHWDAQEVFILQLSGRKHWKVYAPTRPNPLKEDAVQPPPPSGSPLWEGILEDGDMLYMPRGYWHLVTPLGEPSLHLNFGVEPPSGVDFLRWWMLRLVGEADVRAVLPLSAGAVRPDYMAGLLNLITRDCRRGLSDLFLSEWNAYRRARRGLGLPHAPLAQKTKLGLATRVRLAERDALFIECEAGAARFQAAGKCFSTASQLAPALGRLSGHQSLSVGELCSGMADKAVIDALVATLEGLAADGVIVKESGP